MALKRICVFAGASSGSDPTYAAAARALGEVIAARSMSLVYGGGRAGLMGEVADSALAGGAEAIGVMPYGLTRAELAHQGLTRLIEVRDMHERKATMWKLSDAYIALPGGLGTLEELFEVASWAQLGIHDKPLGLFNVGGFYDPLLAMLEHCTSAGFLREDPREFMKVSDSPAALLDSLRSIQPREGKRLWSRRPDAQRE